MKALCVLIMVFRFMFSVTSTTAGEFGAAQSSLEQFRAIRYENVVTKVPTTGQLVSIRVADSGKVYYICREETGYVIYHLEIRPIEGFRDKIEQELKEKSREWSGIYPDELLLTRQRYDLDLGRSVHKYCEAVWVRNEIVVDQPAQPSPAVSPPQDARSDREPRVPAPERQKPRNR